MDERTSGGDLAPLAQAQAIAQDADETDRHNLLVMTLLPPTEWLQRHVGASDPRGIQGERDLRRREERLELGRQRDVLLADRPEGCWCLGLGWPTRPDGYCRCPEGVAAEAEFEREMAVQEAEERKRRIETMWNETAGIPRLFREWRLDTSPLSDGVVAPLRKLEGSWYLWGAYGCGKTGLAIGHAYERLTHGTPAILFRSVPDLLSELRSTYGRNEGPTENDVLDTYAHTGLLILDDLGAEQVKQGASGTSWLEDRLYQVIGLRHREELPIIFTSNLSIKQIADRIGERIAWRIVEMCGEDHIVQVTGPNLRDRRGA